MLDLDRQLFLLGAGCLVWGLARIAYQRGGAGNGLFVSILRDLDAMPQAMRQLAPVQFFSWVALFAMWIYTVPALVTVPVSLVPGRTALLWTLRSVGFSRVEIIPPPEGAYEQLARGQRVMAAAWV